MIDSERTMRGVSQRDLKRWGVSKDQLFDQSVTNLSKLTAPYWAEATRDASQTKLFSLDAQDGYDASRILLPDYYERASRALGCERIAIAVPTRDCLIAFDAGDTALLAKFSRVIARDYEQCPYPISPKLLLLPEDANGQ